MKPSAVFLLFCVASLAASCSPRPEPSVAPLVLGDKEGRAQLSLRSVQASSPNHWTSLLGLRAFGEEILAAPPVGTSDGLWVDGKAVAMKTAGGFRIIERQASNDWSYAAVELDPVQPGPVNKFRRHFLCVEPDLFVVCDEVVLAEPATVEIGWWFPASVAHDSAREEWRLQFPKAGATVRIMAAPRHNEQPRPATSQPDRKPSSVLDVTCVRSGTSAKMTRFRQITVLVPHEKDGRRSLAFKLLESDSAIGVRVHRDGLPTLIAFRKDDTGEANLTGLKFAGPVAVDVFRPKRK